MFKWKDNHKNIICIPFPIRACFLFYCQVSPRSTTPGESFILCLVCFGGTPAGTVYSALRARNRANGLVPDATSHCRVRLPGHKNPNRISLSGDSSFSFQPICVCRNDGWRCFKALRGEMGHMFTQFTILSIFSISVREEIYANCTALFFWVVKRLLSLLCTHPSIIIRVYHERQTDSSTPRDGFCVKR